MKLTLFPGCSDDIRLIDVQEAQRGQINDTILAVHFDDTTLRMFSRTLKYPDGEPVAMMGITPKWPGYATGWALIGNKALKYPLALTKTARKLVERAKWSLCLRRIDIDVDVRHTAAIRWAKHLGFEVEGIQRCHGLQGEDSYLLARVWR